MSGTGLFVGHNKQFEDVTLDSGTVSFMINFFHYLEMELINDSIKKNTDRLIVKVNDKYVSN